MLLTMLFLSAGFLSATVIAGFLMVYQLSQVSRIVVSAKAIYAADAAIERHLFKIFRCNQNPPPLPPGIDIKDIKVFSDSAANDMPIAPPPIPEFLNDASYKLTIEGNPPK